MRHNRREVSVVDNFSPSNRRLFGTLKDKIKIVDPDWWKPMNAEELELFLNGSAMSRKA